MRIFRATILTLALVTAGAATAADQTAAGLTEPQVRQLLGQQGYTKVNDLKFKSGLWQADATSADGKRTEVRVDPASSQIYTDEQVSNLSKDDIKAKLTAAGYTNVHDLNFEDGLWKAKAERAGSGNDIDVRLSPKDGSILQAEGN